MADVATVDELPPPPQAQPTPAGNVASVDELPPPPPVAGKQAIATLDELPPPPAASGIPPSPSTPAPSPGPATPGGKGGTPFVEDNEIAAIAAKHGINPGELKSVAPYFGVHTVPRSFAGSLGIAAKETAGAAGEMALGIPQFLYKKTQSDNFQHALDDLHELSESRKGLVEKSLAMGRQLVMPLPAVGATTRLGRIATATGIGAVAGATGARTGEELRGAAAGAAGGAVLGTAAEGAVALLGKLGQKLSPAEQELVRTRQFDVQKGAQEVADRTAQSDAIIRDTLIGEKASLTAPEIDTVLEQKLGPEATAKYLDPATHEGQAIREQLGGDTSEPAIKQKLAGDILDDRAIDFGRELTGKSYSTPEDAIDAIQDYTNRQGSEYVSGKYDQYTGTRAAEQWAEENGAVAANQPGFVGQTLNKLSAVKYVLRHFDDKYNVGAELAAQDLNRAKNRLTFPKAAADKDRDAIFQWAQQNGVDDAIRNSDKIYEAMDTGDFSGLTPQEQEAAQKFRKYFDDVREFSNGVVTQRDPNISPLSIPKRENYVPHIAKTVDEVVPLVEQKMQEAYSQASEIAGREITDFTQLTPGEWAQVRELQPTQDLMDFANWGTETRAGFDKPAELSASLKKSIYTREGNIGLESRARAAMARTGEIPDFITEKNLYKLGDRYTQNTLTHLYLRQPLDKLAAVTDRLEAVGAKPEAEYVRTLRQDALGIRPGTAAEATMRYRTAVQSRLQKAIDEAGPNSPTGIALRAAKTVPDLVEWSSRQLYHNVLGWRPKSVLMHLGASVGRLPQEVGGVYGYELAGRGVVNTVLNFDRNFARAQALGNVPEKYIRGAQNAMREGIAASLPARMIDTAANKLGEIGMTAFQAGEHWNRALCVGMSDMMAHDLVSGGIHSGMAQRALQRFPAAIREEITRVMPQGEQAVADSIARYMNDTALFNYNRTSMYQYGRTLGKFFSTFSTWPTSISGEVLYELRSKGLGAGMARSFERLVMPYLAFKTVNYALFHKGEATGQHYAQYMNPFSGKKGDQTEVKGRAQALFTKEGLPHILPIGSLKEFASGKLMTPPAVDVLWNGIVKPGIEGDPQKISHGLDNALYDYAPGTGFMRGMTDDLVTGVTGKRPEGKSFVERTQSGARTLKKLVTPK